MTSPKPFHRSAHVLLLAVIVAVLVPVTARSDNVEFTSLAYSLETEDIYMCCIFALVTGNAWAGWTFNSFFGTEGDGGTIAELPEKVNVDAMARANGGLYFSVDRTVVLDGLTLRPADVVRRDDVTGDFTLEFVGDDDLVPFPTTRSEANLDAIAFVDTPSVEGSVMVVSFDTPVVMEWVESSCCPPISATGFNFFEDEDLAYADGHFYFDGSEEGLPASVDVDGAHFSTALGELLLTLDTSATVGGVTAHDNDVLRYAPDTGTWMAGPSSFTATALDALFELTANPPLFCDGFESGATSAWSSVSP